MGRIYELVDGDATESYELGKGYWSRLCGYEFFPSDVDELPVTLITESDVSARICSALGYRHERLESELLEFCERHHWNVKLRHDEHEYPDEVWPEDGWSTSGRTLPKRVGSRYEY